MTAQQDIQGFVELVLARQKRALAPAEKEHLEALDEALRTLIDGARPAPKKIANPSPSRPAGSAPSAPVAVAQVRQRSPSAAAAPATVTPAKNRPLPPPAVVTPAKPPAPPPLAISAADKKKLNPLSLAQLSSSYTPSRRPAYLADYYDEDISLPELSGDLTPNTVVAADGGEVSLREDAKILLGLVAPKPRAVIQPSAPSVADALPVIEPEAVVPVEEAPDEPATPVQPMEPVEAEPVIEGLPVIVHMLAGGTRRGQIAAFEPELGTVQLIGAEELPLSEVLAIFFGVRKGGATHPGGGEPVVVRLVNDKQVTGRTADYQEGAIALTVVPEPRRGSIDFIWVPAWSVKAIRLG